MAPAYSTTLKADMLAAFPEAPPKIIGIPNLREMIRVMYHMMACSQSHASAASPLALGLLFVCLPIILAQEHAFERMREAGIIPNHQILDNEVS